jgi:hypothetical protein
MLAAQTTHHTDRVLSAIVLYRVAPASTVMAALRCSDWRSLCLVLSDRLLATLLSELRTQKLIKALVASDGHSSLALRLFVAGLVKLQVDREKLVVVGKVRPVLP